MIFTPTCHLVRAVLAWIRRRLDNSTEAQAEDAFLTTAPQKLEESARMLAQRRAVLRECVHSSGLTLQMFSSPGTDIKYPQDTRAI